MNPKPVLVLLMVVGIFMSLLSACAISESEYEPGAALAITATATLTFQPVTVTRVVIEADVTPTATATPPFPFMAKPMSTPRADFIEAVSPPENRVIPHDVYTRQPAVGEVGFGFGLNAELICVQPVAILLVQEGDIFVDDWQDGEKLWGRMELWVNGQAAKYMGNARGFPYSLPTREPEGPRTDFFEWVSYCWEAPLGIGVHEVTFRFRQTSGDVKEYTWHFELSE
ncbi:MAG: hypothetical protein KJ063_25415 [Anaerolineae bacterium]|nr:hypothetical protein [Anaerolineae bacterium]